MNFDIIYCRFGGPWEAFLAARKIRAFYWREYGVLAVRLKSPLSRL